MLTPNGRINKRRTVQFMVALTILAWATQTLLHQWGFGAEAPLTPAQEKFVSRDGASRGATIELRAEATIIGPEIRLKQVCRWSDADAEALSPLADLVIARITPEKPFKSISVNEIKSVLFDAHVNLATINFVGVLSCTINRSDAEYDQRNAMQQWIDAKSGGPDASPATAPVANASTRPAEVKPAPTLRDRLTGELAERLNLPADTIQLSFKQQDEAALNLSEPLFKFQIEPARQRNLGQVQWDVTVIARDGKTRKLSISATARTWQNQAVLAKPLAFKQIIHDADVTERRVLADSLPSEPLVTKTQAVGQQAARELKPGTVLGARMLDPVELVKHGQFVTVTVLRGAVSIKTVARAMEDGSLGQTIKVKNETTRDMYDVTVTGPQTATLDGATPPAGRVALKN